MVEYRIGPDLREIPIEDEEYDEDYDDEEWACTWCGGEGIDDDPNWDDWCDKDGIYPCRCCNGTGLRKHQTIF